MDNNKVNCETNNCVYMISCQKCNSKYIGETGRMLKARLSDHRAYINNQVLVSPLVTTSTEEKKHKKM